MTEALQEGLQRLNVPRETIMFTDIASVKQRDELSLSTHSQTGTAKSGGLPTGTSNPKGIITRIPHDIPLKHGQVDTPSGVISVSDGTASLDAQDRCDDGSDDNIFSPKVSERVAITGIGTLSAIKPVRL